MRLFLPTAMALAWACMGATTVSDHSPSAPSMAACDAASITRLLEPALFESFFHCVDSMRRVHYPDDDQDTTIAVDLSPYMLEEFLRQVDYDEFQRIGECGVGFQFNIAPKGHRDPPACRDSVWVHFSPERCGFRMVVKSTFLVEPNWCIEHNVSYGFRIGKDRVVDFGRNEAG